ncbi:MAG TPA: hypothetical protein VJN65_07160 [Bacteroidota bacterium]|nr:hypothetical protein [Bacteroidota bacterium]
MTDNTPEDLKGRSLFWKMTVRFGLIPIIILFYGTVALHFDYTPDDTYIYLKYAKSLAEGSGFSFNEGEPSSGITGPLWVFMIAAGTAGGLDPYVVAKTLDLLFASLSIFLVYALAHGIVRDRILAFVAACMMAFDSWMLRWAGSGMETSLGVLLTLLVFWYVYRAEYVLASLVSGFLTLVRPEGALLFALVQVDYGFLKRDPAAIRRMALRSILVYSLVLAPWVVYAASTFGTPLPNTLEAKSISSFSVGSVLFVGGSEAKILLSTQSAALMALILGLVAAFRRMNWKILRLEIFPLFWVLALLLFYLSANIQVVSRYLLPATPIVCIFGIWGVKKIQEFWKLSWRWTSGLIAAMFLFTAIQNAAVYGSTVVPHMRGFTEGMNGCLKPIAYWLRENSSPEARVLTPDIGLLGYVSGRRLFDTAGLVTPEMKKAFSGVSYDEGMKARKYESVLRPDFIVDRSEQPERLAAPDLIPVMTKEFPNIAINKSEPVYYTLYKVVR